LRHGRQLERCVGREGVAANRSPRARDYPEDLGYRRDRYYNNDPVIGLQVEVTQDGRPPYIATIEKALISRLDVPQFQPERVIPVRVDPNDPQHVTIDFNAYK